LIFEGFEYDSIHFLASGTVTGTLAGFFRPAGSIEAPKAKI
jgi:hypothetical protein